MIDLGRLLGGIFRGRPAQAARLAVLIDGDGISTKDARKVLDYLPALGRVCITRVYGNYSGSAAASWAPLILSHGLVVRHLPSLVSGKNATDIALTIDAVELLLTRELDAFVLVTNDSDFAPLARRVREEGKDAFGFGGAAAPAAFGGACTAYHDIRALASPDMSALTPGVLWSLSPTHAEPIVRAALTHLCASNLPVTLSELGQYLSEHYPGFDTRVYRRRSLGELVRDLPSVTVVERDGLRVVQLSILGG